MVLIIGLVLLIAATMITMASFNLGFGDFKIVGNMQHRAEAAGVAQQAIDEAISSTRFFETPSAVYFPPCSDQNTYCADVTGDGSNDIMVRLDPEPACRIARGIKNAELDLSQPEDLGCAVGVQQSFGTEGSATGDSLCAQTTWEIRAEADDAVTQTLVAIGEGVAVRIPLANMVTNCP